MKRNRPFIKAGYVWRWVNDKNVGLTGYMAWRPAGLIETLLFKYFGRVPKVWKP